MTADTVVVPWVYIEPLVLFHPLLYSPILSPSNTCHHIDTRVKNLGLEERVAHFMDWIIAQTKQPKKTINSLDIFDLEKYHCRLDKRYKKPWCIPPSKPTPCNHPVPTKPARGHSDTDHTKTIHGAHRTMGGRPVNTSQVPQRHRRTWLPFNLECSCPNLPRSVQASNRGGVLACSRAPAFQGTANPPLCRGNGIRLEILFQRPGRHGRCHQYIHFTINFSVGWLRGSPSGADVGHNIGEGSLTSFADTSLMLARKKCLHSRDGRNLTNR